MTAAAELIGELGWGRVTTRAVAERAGLPLGSVSYHFRGKQELLVEAALAAFERAAPVEQFASLGSLAQLSQVIEVEVREAASTGSLSSRLMFETMREAERDPGVRQRMGTLLASYRALMTSVVRADQERGAVTAQATPEAIATLLAAVGDGLLLHALLDPGLDVTATMAALRSLLSVAQPDGDA